MTSVPEILTIEDRDSHEPSTRLAEASLLLRWAAAALNPTERLAVSAFAVDVVPVAAEIGRSRSAIWMARQTGLEKMRRRLERIGIRSSGDVL